MARKYESTIGRSKVRKSLTEPAVTDTEDVDLGSLKKDDLVALAEEREVDSSGTKDELVARLQEA